MGLSKGQSPTTPVAEKHYAEPPRAVAAWRQDGGTLVLVVEPVSASAAPTAPPASSPPTRWRTSALGDS